VDTSRSRDQRHEKEATARRTQERKEEAKADWEEILAGKTRPVKTDAKATKDITKQTWFDSSESFKLLHSREGDESSKETLERRIAMLSRVNSEEDAYPRSLERKAVDRKGQTQAASSISCSVSYLSLQT